MAEKKDIEPGVEAMAELERAMKQYERYLELARLTQIPSAGEAMSAHDPSMPLTLSLKV